MTSVQQTFKDRHNEHIAQQVSFQMFMFRTSQD